MRRTTLFVDEEVDRDLKAFAGRRQVPVSAVVREALARYVREETRREGLALGFLAAGRSGRGDVADRSEEFVFARLTPHRRKARAKRPSRGRAG